MGRGRRGAHLRAMDVGVNKEVGVRAPHQRQAQRWPGRCRGPVADHQGLGGRAGVQRAGGQATMMACRRGRRQGSVCGRRLQASGREVSVYGGGASQI
jgi:hypothetical protein